MPSHYDQLRDDYVTGEPLPASEYNSLVRILDTQLEGALEGIGAGVIEGGRVTAGSGLAVNISPLKAVAETQYGLCFLSTYGANAAVNDLPDNSTSYIWARAVFPLNPGDPDSRESGHVEFYWSVSDEGEADALLLAEVHTAAGAVVEVVDRRTFIPAQRALQIAEALDADLSAIKEAIGEEYFGDNPPAASLHERVTALESGTGGSGEAGPVYWGALEKAAGDPTTIEQAIDERLQQHVTDYHSAEQQGGATITIQDFDVDAANQGRMVLKLTRSVDPDLPKYFTDAVVVVWGCFGDGSGGTPDFIDREHSTWLPEQ